MLGSKFEIQYKISCMLQMTSALFGSNIYSTRCTKYFFRQAVLRSLTLCDLPGKKTKKQQQNKTNKQKDGEKDKKRQAKKTMEYSLTKNPVQKGMTSIVLSTQLQFHLLAKSQESQTAGTDSLTASRNIDW